jgi:predicted permease
VYKKVIGYALFLTMIGILQTIGSCRLIRELKDSPAEGEKHSLLAHTLLITWDSFVVLAHFYLTLMNRAYFQILIGPSVLLFILYSFLGNRMIMEIWRQTNVHADTVSSTLGID